MHTPDDLIKRVASASRIPFRKRRQEIERELRAHIEDSITAARDAGRCEREIEDMLAATFGDPAQIGEAFAWVYRRERALVRVSVFLLSTVAVTSLMLSAILALQAGIALGFGKPVLKLLASPHTAIEALDILFTVTTYTALVALEELFARNRSLKALAMLAVAFAVVWGICAAVDFRAPFLVFGLVNGAFFRIIEVFVKSGAARTGMVLAAVALLGFVFLPFHLPYALMACTSWLAMAAAYRQMPGVVARMDAALFHRFQRT